jgi:hypothetical protein
VRVLLKFAMDKLPPDQIRRINQLYLDFQKQFGTREDLEELLLRKRR